MEITIESARTKRDFAVLIYNYKNESFGDFIEVVETAIELYGLIQIEKKLEKQLDRKQ